MPAVLVEIADAVLAVLTAEGAAYGSLSEDFVPERAYIPIYTKQDEEGADELATLKVTVVPILQSLVPITRGADHFDYGINVGIQQRLGIGQTTAEINALCDPLMLLAEEILDLFRGKPLDGYPFVMCVSASNEVPYAPAHLDEHRVFTSLITLGFRKARAR